MAYGNFATDLQRYAPLWSSVALEIHGREGAGNMFFGEVLPVAARRDASSMTVKGLIPFALLSVPALF